LIEEKWFSCIWNY